MRHLLVFCVLPLVLLVSVVRSDDEDQAVDEPVGLDLTVAVEEPQQDTSRHARQTYQDYSFLGQQEDPWGVNWDINRGGNVGGGNWGGGNWGGGYSGEHGGHSGRSCRPPRGCQWCPWVRSGSPLYCKNWCLDRPHCICQWWK